jgi:hypothetical protein
MKFGPVNLWVLPPAWGFYMSKDEKTKLAIETYLWYNVDNKKGDIRATDTSKNTRDM